MIQMDYLAILTDVSHVHLSDQDLSTY